MIIQGKTQFIPDNEFKPKIEQALDLLKSKSSSDYLLVTTLVEKIRAAGKTGAVVDDALIDIARDTFNSSLTWLASVLTHETSHIVQRISGRRHIGEAAEKEANMMQLFTLRCVGAPQNEINYLLSQDGKHFDLDGDGKYTQEDYRRRTY